MVAKLKGKFMPKEYYCNVFTHRPIANGEPHFFLSRIVVESLAISLSQEVIRSSPSV